MGDRISGIGIGSLQVMLDTGQRKDWFSSDYIRTFTACAFLAVALIVRELMTDHPVVDLRVLRNRSFSAGVFLISMLGFVLYASLVLLPLYLQTLMGYPAYNSGMALSPRGLGALLFTPLAGHLTTKTDPRRLLAVGIVLGSISMFQLSGLNLYAGFWDIFWAQVLQGVALSFLFIPLMSLAMSHIQPDKMGNATSIFNLMRNIGGSVGIALMTTLLARRSQVHQNHLVANITRWKRTDLQNVAGATELISTRWSGCRDGSRKSIAAIYGMVQQHAAMLAFVEAFWLMGVVFLMMLPFLPLLEYSKAAKKPKVRPSGLVSNSFLRTLLNLWRKMRRQEALEEEHHLVLH